jgi:uncharacterized SAM-binding protein YcdF (DUF218 family)
MSVMKRISSVILIVAACFFLNACVLFRPSVSKMTKRALKANATYDAIIVPGIPFEEPTWDRVMQLRLVWAKHLYDKGIAKNIITSGSAVYTPYVEAKIMAAYLVAMGVPEDHILIEERAEHSTENVWYGNKLARSKGFKSVAVCSDPFQSKLLYRFAKRRTKKQVYFLPAIFDTVRTLPHDTPVVNYSALKVDGFVSITKRESKWKRFMGTLGRHIDFKDEN